MGYDVVQLYEWLILSETKFWSTQEDAEQLVFKKSTDDIVLLCGFYNIFDSSKGKYLILLTTGSTSLNSPPTYLFTSVLGTY